MYGNVLQLLNIQNIRLDHDSCSIYLYKVIKLQNDIGSIGLASKVAKKRLLLSSKKMCRELSKIYFFLTQRQQTCQYGIFSICLIIHLSAESFPIF